MAVRPYRLLGDELGLAASTRQGLGWRWCRAHLAPTGAREPYQNQFAQFLTLRWGKVAEDLVLEDTATWENASRRLAATGTAEAAEPSLAPSRHDAHRHLARGYRTAVR